MTAGGRGVFGSVKVVSCRLPSEEIEAAMATNEPVPDAGALLREYVLAGTVLQGATAAPWSWNCWYAADSDLSMFFLSKTTRRHSVDILGDSRVSGVVIHTIPVIGPGSPVQAVHFEGDAGLVAESDLQDAYELYAGRWATAPSVPSIELLRKPDGIDRLWRIVPRTFVLFDEVHFPGSPRQELTQW
jgi:uncharacterized protein YhbP (UPF0306 family)